MPQQENTPHLTDEEIDTEIAELRERVRGMSVEIDFAMLLSALNRKILQLQQQVKELQEGASRADGEAILKAKGEAWEECAAKAYESTGMTRTAARVLHALNPYPLPSSTPTTPDA